MVFLRMQDCLSVSAFVSEYSCCLIVIMWNVLKLASMEPPTHAAFFLCKASVTMISVLASWAIFLSSNSNLAGKFLS